MNVSVMTAGVLLTLLPIAHGQTYLESLHKSLIPVNLRFDYDIRLLFRDAPQTVPMCGNHVSVRRLFAAVRGVQTSDGQTAVVRSAAGSDANLGTSVYRVQPTVNIRYRRPIPLLFSWWNERHWYRHILGTRNPRDDRFCFFMFDAGLASQQSTNDTERLMDASRPFIHWAVCNIQGRDLNSGDTLVEYMPVPATGTQCKRIVWALMRQGHDNNVTSLNNFVPDSCPDFANGRCQFNLAEFMSQNAEMDVISVLTTRAAPDVVGLNMMQTMMKADDLCALYTDITANYAPVADGWPISSRWASPFLNGGYPDNIFDDEGDDGGEWYRMVTHHHPTGDAESHDRHVGSSNNGHNDIGRDNVWPRLIRGHPGRHSMNGRHSNGHKTNHFGDHNRDNNDERGIFVHNPVNADDNGRRRIYDYDDNRRINEDIGHRRFFDNNRGDIDDNGRRRIDHDIRGIADDNLRRRMFVNNPVNNDDIGRRRIYDNGDNRGIYDDVGRRRLYDNDRETNDYNDRRRTDDKGDDNDDNGGDSDDSDRRGMYVDNPVNTNDNDRRIVYDYDDNRRINLDNDRRRIFDDTRRTKDTNDRRRTDEYRDDNDDDNRRRTNENNRGISDENDRRNNGDNGGRGTDDNDKRDNNDDNDDDNLASTTGNDAGNNGIRHNYDTSDDDGINDHRINARINGHDNNNNDSNNGDNNDDDPDTYGYLTANDKNDDNNNDDDDNERRLVIVA